MVKPQFETKNDRSMTDPRRSADDAASAVREIPVAAAAATEAVQESAEAAREVTVNAFRHWADDVVGLPVKVLAGADVGPFLSGRAWLDGTFETVIALFLQSPTLITLPVQMYNSITVEIDPTISAAASIVVVLASLLIAVPQIVAARRAVRKAMRRVGRVYRSSAARTEPCSTRFSMFSHYTPLCELSRKAGLGGGP